ncbi:hypothetical protein ACSBR2_026168 [Camellia fascicularis]
MEEISEAPSLSSPPSYPTSQHSKSLRDSKARARKPPDPDPDIGHGRSDELAGDFSSQDERLCDRTVVRERDRSNSPRRYHLVDRANQIDNSARVEQLPMPSTPLHSLQMASMRSMAQDHRRIRSILPQLATDPLLIFSSMESLKILIWNCRGAGNSTFRRNMRNLIQSDKPGILVLMETKVLYSSMGISSATLDSQQLPLLT